METIAWIGFSQALFAGILIATKQKKELHDRLLSVWLFLCSIEFINLVISIRFEIFLLSTPFLIFNPILYFYIKSLIKNNFKVKWIDLLHAIPYLFFLAFSYLSTAKITLDNYFEKQPYLWLSYLFAAVIILSFFVYSVLGIKEIHKYRMNLKNMVSTIDARKNLKWLLSLLIYYIVYFIVTVILGAINVFANIVTYTIIVSYANLLFLVYLFGFYGLYQKAVYIHKPVESQAEKYKNSSLTQNQKLKIQTELEKLFEEQKIYLDSDLTIQNVADKLNIQRHTLTEVLNSDIGKNFYQFVNEYRIDEVKKMLSNKKNDILSIEAIGYDCGFNSKSTFFAVFKNFTGITPMQYKKSR